MTKYRVVRNCSGTYDIEQKLLWFWYKCNISSYNYQKNAEQAAKTWLRDKDAKKEVVWESD